MGLLEDTNVVRREFVQALLAKVGERPRGFCADCWESDAWDLAANVFAWDKEEGTFDRKLEDAATDLVSRGSLCWCNVRE